MDDLKGIKTHPHFVTDAEAKWTHDMGFMPRGWQRPAIHVPYSKWLTGNLPKESFYVVLEDAFGYKSDQKESDKLKNIHPHSKVLVQVKDLCWIYQNLGRGMGEMSISYKNVPILPTMALHESSVLSLFRLMPFKLLQQMDAPEYLSQKDEKDQKIQGLLVSTRSFLRDYLLAEDAGKKLDIDTFSTRLRLLLEEKKLQEDAETQLRDQRRSALKAFKKKMSDGVDVKIVVPRAQDVEMALKTLQDLCPDFTKKHALTFIRDLVQTKYDRQKEFIQT